MNLVSYALNILVPKVKVFERLTKNPFLAQKRLLLEIIAKNKKTEYGEKYSFSKIKTIKDYQQSLPLTNYESLRPLIKRMLRGQNNILTCDDIVFYSVTSGTTGRPKFIPETRQALSKKENVMDFWIYYLSVAHPKVFDGKVLTIVSAEVEGYTQNGVPYGTESGHGYKKLPGVIQRLQAIPPQVFEIKDYEARYYCILRLAIEQNVTDLAALNPSTIMLLCQKAVIYQDEIIEDIEKGTLNKNFSIPGNVREQLEKSLRANFKRAEELREIVAEKKELLPKYFWPNLELIECWKGGTVGLYLKDFSKYFGCVSVRDFGYLSSEARCSIPIDDVSASGVLALDTNFYEFVPKEDINKEEKRYLLCQQLEKGKEYFIVLTTFSGLYRYNIDDLIRVTGFFNKTPMIEFVQKGLNVTSITGEKVYESQVVEAINDAVEKLNVSLQFCTATLQWGNPPRYIFLAEFNDFIDKNKKQLFLSRLEEQLSSLNVEYKTKRQSQRLATPILKVVKQGGFDKYRRQRAEDRSNDGQFKLPELTTDINFQGNFEIEEEIDLL